MENARHKPPYRRKRKNNSGYDSNGSHYRKSRMHSSSHSRSNSRHDSRDDAEVSDDRDYSGSVHTLSRPVSARTSAARTSRTSDTTTTASPGADEEFFKQESRGPGRPSVGDYRDPLGDFLNKRYSNDNTPSCIIGGHINDEEKKRNSNEKHSPPERGAGSNPHRQKQTRKQYSVSVTEDEPAISQVSLASSENPLTHHEQEIVEARKRQMEMDLENWNREKQVTDLADDCFSPKRFSDEFSKTMKPRLNRQKSQTMLEMEAILSGVRDECAESDRGASEFSEESSADQIDSSIRQSSIRSVRFLDPGAFGELNPRKRSLMVGESIRTSRQEEAAELVSMITGAPRVSTMFRVNSTESLTKLDPSTGKRSSPKSPENNAILEQFFDLLDLGMEREIDLLEFQTKACGILSEMGPEIDMKGRSRKLFEEMTPDNKRTFNADDVENYLNKKIENKLQVLRMMSALRTTKNMNQQEEERLAQKVFHLLDMNQEGHIQSIEFQELLEANGLNADDYRLREFFYRLKKIHGLRNAKLSFKDFLKLIRGLPHTYSLVDMLFSKKLIVPDFPEFKKEIEQMYNEMKKDDGNPFAISICTVDGQELSFGEADLGVAIQGIVKPLCYLLACEEHGFDFVHHHLGREPTGKVQDAAYLKPSPTTSNAKRRIPHNPFVEAGTIVACSLILADSNASDRFSHIRENMARLCSSNSVSFCNETYLKLRASANREMCLAHMLQEYSSFPPGTSLDKTLELYFQTRAVKANSKSLARAAATLANGGKNPKSDDQIFDREDVRNCLSLMLSSGMADASGLWGFDVGIPAKASRSGYLMCVIPNKMGMVIYAPPVDKAGRSTRAMDFMKQIVQSYNFHQYDNLRGVINASRKKKDPTQHMHSLHCKQVMETIYACARGDLNHLTHLNSTGVDIFQGDYDNRNGLHLAASEGHLSICKYFAVIARKRRAPHLLNQQDRWGRTPLDDALACSHQDIINFLIRYGATRGPKTETFRVLGFNLIKQ